MIFVFNAPLYLWFRLGIRTRIDKISETTKLIYNIKNKSEYSLFDKTELELPTIIDLQFWEILKKVQELTRYINISGPDILQSIVPKYYDHIENYLGGLEQLPQTTEQSNRITTKATQINLSMWLFSFLIPPKI